jgi:hypothetical protein
MRSRVIRSARVATLLGIALAFSGCRNNHATSAAPSQQAASSNQGERNPALQAWRKKYPGSAALMQAVSGIRILLAENRHPIGGDQARYLVRSLSPLPGMSSLPQDQALKIAEEVDGDLTPDQQTDIGMMRTNMRTQGGFRRGGRGAGAMSGKQRRGAAGRSEVMRGGGSANRGGGMRWIRMDMAPDENVFQQGPMKRTLDVILSQLKIIEKG